MKAFFEWTAWKMTPPEPYGAFHLIFFFGGLLLAILITNRLKNCSEKTNRIVLVSCGVFLIICEVYKQLFYYYVIGDSRYIWWIFPWQLCSIPMYLCIIAPFMKNKKIQNMMYNFLMTFNFFGGFIAFFEPSGLIHEYYTLTIHAFIWHMLLVFIGLYLWRSNRAGNKLKDFLSAIPVFITSAVIAEIINVVMKGKDGINMFYISPYQQSPIIVFKELYVKLGWILNGFLFLFSLLLGSFIFFMIFYFMKEMFKNNKVKLT